MKLISGTLDGIYVIHPEKKIDNRGHLARTFCRSEFQVHGLNTQWDQHNHTLTRKKGAIRGLHWQEAPYGEVKLVRCIRGKVWDVVVDIRQNSPTFGQWEASILDPESLMAIYIPEGFAHGFQCIEDECELYYMMSSAYHPESARCLLWNDSTVAIPWPLEITDISPKDEKGEALSSIF